MHEENTRNTNARSLAVRASPPFGSILAELELWRANTDSQGFLPRFRGAREAGGAQTNGNRAHASTAQSHGI